MTSDEPVFPDKAHAPSDADLASALGRVKRHWDSFAAHAVEANPDAKPEWSFYSKKAGWFFLLRGKRRNIVYLTPCPKHFRASFAFGEKAVKAALESNLPDDVVKLIKAAPKYPEGRGIRLEVRTAADVKIAKKLLAIKMAH